METAKKDSPIEKNPAIDIAVSAEGAAAKEPSLHKYFEVVRHSLRKDIEQALNESAKDGAGAQFIAVINTLEKAKMQISGRKAAWVHVNITGKREGVKTRLHYSFHPQGE